MADNIKSVIDCISSDFVNHIPPILESAKFRLSTYDGSIKATLRNLKYDVELGVGMVLSRNNEGKCLFKFQTFLSDFFILSIRIMYHKNEPQMMSTNYQEDGSHTLQYSIDYKNPEMSKKEHVFSADFQFGENSEGYPQMTNPVFFCIDIDRASLFFGTICIGNRLNIPYFYEMISKLSTMGLTGQLVERSKLVLSVFSYMTKTNQTSFCNAELTSSILSDSDIVTISDTISFSNIMFVDIPISIV